jgi:branched-chain amino acid transport system permease protein
MTDILANSAHARSRQGSGVMRHATVWIVAALILAVLPQVFSNSSSITIMNQMAITAVFALAYNMLLGQGGMLSFGHAVYMGLGGFACMHLLNYIEIYELPFPLPFLPIVGGLAGMFWCFFQPAAPGPGSR